MLALPLFPLLLGSVLTWLMRRWHERVGWLITLVSTGLAWVGTWGLGRVVPSASAFLYWGRPGTPVELEFALDAIGWQAILATATALLVIALTGVTRRAPGTAGARATMLAYGGLSMAAMLAGNMLTAVVSWSLLDLVFILLLRPAGEDDAGRRDFGIRVALNLASVLTLVLAAALEVAAGGSTSFSTSPVSIGSAGLLVLAGLLRLGLLPPHFSLPDVPGVRRGLGTALRLLPPVVALSVMGRALQGGAPAQLSSLLWVVGIGGLAIGAWRWALADSAMEGRRFYVVAICALGAVAIAQPAVNASEALSAVIGMLLIPGVMLSVLELRAPLDRLWPVVIGLLLVGFPWSPGAELLNRVAQAGGRAGLAGAGVLCVGMSVMAFGALRLTRMQYVDWASAEPLTRILYRAGMVFGPAVGLALGLSGRSPGHAAGWIGFGAGAVLAGGWDLAYRRMSPRRVGRAARLGFLLDPGPAYRFAGQVYAAAAGLLRGLMETIEGGGAMVWTYVVILLIWLAAQ
jgi:uncharacterized membrane protein YidH (DUF202 family)